MRAKKILGIKNINIYSLVRASCSEHSDARGEDAFSLSTLKGVYVDEAAAKKALASKYKTASEDAIERDQKIFNGVTGSLFSSLLTTIIRSVEPSQM